MAWNGQRDGIGGAGASHTQLKVDGVQVCALPTAGLAAGTSATVSCMGKPKAGTHTLVATADATGLPVHCGPVEATALGNAATQLVALGELADLADIRRVIAGTTDMTSYAPAPDGLG